MGGAGLPRFFVFVESNTSGSGRLFSAAAQRAGMVPIMLADRPARYPFVEEEGIRILVVDTQSEEAILQACRDLSGEGVVVGITSTSDHFIHPASNVARRLGLPGPSPEAVKACRDKEVQLRVLTGAGVPSPRYARSARVDEAMVAAREIGFPVVLKPISGTGSFGVRYCATPEEVEEHARRLLSLGSNERGVPLPPGLLVEQWWVGTEYSVEVFQGRVLGITRKHPSALPHFVAIQHDFPGEIPEADAQGLERITEVAVRALDLGWGPIHVEFKVGPEGPVLIEVNPRLGGAMIPELMRLARGFDIVAATVELAAGGDPTLQASRSGFASIRFVLTPHDGRLVRIDGLDRAAAVDGVLSAIASVQPGDRLVRHGDYRDRVIHVVAVNPDPVVSRRAVQQATSLLSLVLEEGSRAESANGAV